MFLEFYGKIYCGECGAAYVGNARLAGRNKIRYVSYRCNRRDRTHACDNKEIAQDWIEDYVLAQIKEKLLNPESAEIIARQVSQYYQKKNNKVLKDL